MKRLSVLLALLSVTLVLGGCAAEKSANPLSASVAGPIPGVEITAPKLLEPYVGAKIPVDNQPVTLLIENASSNGPRPLTYTIEVAMDANFSNKVFERTGIAPGEGGRTSLRLADPLASMRSYFWRARAEDGANTGPYASAAAFDVFTPIVIGEPVLVSPILNTTVSTLRPKFVLSNAARSGPVGPITYIIEISNSDTFAQKIVIGPIAEQPGQTSVDPPADGQFSSYYFWHARASDPTTTGPWSETHAFSTPAAPPTPPSEPPGGGGAGPAGHVGPGPLSEARASQVVQATAREFPGLVAVFGSEGEAVGAADVLLRRTIWHLQLAGFNAARQKNPSGAISSDKVSIFIDGAWHCYDIYSLGVAGRATTVHFLEVPLPNPVADGGIPD